jgi:UDP-3-O-[3-hydroxymyristoyl] glucosamine N-acyltransferase
VTSEGLTAQAVADFVGGRLLGDGEVRLTGVGPIDRAGPGMLTLAVSPHYASALRTSRAAAVLLPPSLEGSPAGPAARIVVGDPYAAMARVLPRLFPPTARSPGNDPTARVGSDCRLGVDVAIGPIVVRGRCVQLGDRCHLAEGVSLGDGVVVGEDSRIDSRVVCYPGARIGRRVVLKAGAVIGGDGFG